MSDPLSLLREFCLAGKEVVVSGDQLVFGDLSYDRTVPTNYYPGSGAPYSLEAVWALYTNKALPFAEYIKKCRTEGLPRVQLADREALLSYLSSSDAAVPPAVKAYAVDAERPQPKRLLSEADRGGDRAAKKPRLARPTTAGEEVVSAQEITYDNLKEREVPAATRTSVLQRSKDLSMVLEVLNRVKKEDEKKKKERAAKEAASKGDYDRYSVPENQLWKGNIGFEHDEIGIDTTGSFAQLGGIEFLSNSTPMRGLGSGGASGSGSSGQSSYASSSGAGSVSKGDPSRRPTSSSSSSLGSSSSSSSSTSRTGSSSSGSSGSSSRAKLVPIIVVPSAITSILTLYNIADFLQDAEFVTTQDRKDQGVRRQQRVVVVRKKDKETSVRYIVVDNVKELTDEEWERVVGVFALGPLWQFKDWRLTTPVEIFHNYCGFHIHYDDEKVPANISKWDVKILTISKTKRHLDSSVVVEFWRTLDNFITRHKPHLKY